MPGANCSVPLCGKCRNAKSKENCVGHKFGIFKVPSIGENPEWRSNVLNAITKGRVVTPQLRKKIDKGTVWVCEEHFKEEEIYRCKYSFITWHYLEKILFIFKQLQTF